MTSKDMKRRDIIKGGAIVGAGGIALGGTAMGAPCLLTPAQTTGPFYPEPQHKWEDNDLIRRNGSSANAQGTPLVLFGRVFEGDICKPVVGAKVEIWQADNHGKYKHSGDNQPVPLDPNFQYFGKSLTNNQGVYYFRTILPGKYPARTPHIHYRVVTRDGRQLVSQLYFAQYAQWNAQDGIYREMQRRGIADRVTTNLAPSKRFQGAYQGKWDITISSKRRATPFID